MADGLINPWSAATDTLLQTLAQRDAAARIEEQRQRQMQLDAEDKADRERLRTHQENQLRDLAESRREAAADRQAGIDARAAEAAAKGLKDFELQGLVDQYQHEQDPAKKARLKEQLMIKHDIKFAAEPARTGSWRKRAGPGGTEIEEWEWNPLPGEPMPGARTVYHPAVKGPGEPKPDPRALDNPNFPRGSQAWVDSVLREGLPLDETLSRIAEGWPQQVAVHPNADLTEAAKYVKNFYGGPTNRPLIKAPGAAGGGGAAGAGGAPGGADPLRAQATQMLQAENQRRAASGEQQLDDSEAGIAVVMRNLQNKPGGVGGPRAAPTAAPSRPGEVEVDVTKAFGDFQPPAGIRSGTSLRMAPPPGSAPPPGVRPVITPQQRAQATQSLRQQGQPVNDTSILAEHNRLLVQGNVPITPQRPGGVRPVLTPSQRQQAIATLKLNNQPVNEDTIMEMYRTLVMQGQVWK